MPEISHATIIEGLAARLEASPLISGQLVLPSRKGVYADFPGSLDVRLAAALKSRGIGELYSHQAETYEKVSHGADVVVVTPTASGKTLAYNLPVLDSLLADPDACALYLFPTRALGHDQVAALEELLEAVDEPIGAASFDGDTPADARRAIRQSARIVITNPDMLHTGMLPHHTKWQRFFCGLRFVVIDELHSFRGVFGSHFANVMRRLKRICHFYGSEPQFICCSATIANPSELAQLITGRTVECVDSNGAPSGEKRFYLYNPPVLNEALGIRRSYIRTAEKLAGDFIDSQVSTIVFARSRLNVERITKGLKDRMNRQAKSQDLVQGYRGGYLPELRRSIERGLRDGSVRGVVSTNALELGIDIGSLETCIIAGYPGSISSTWQQAGRAGRRGVLGLAVLVASSQPLDQFIANHPEYFFEQSSEHARIDPDNIMILLSHFRCAAFELPFREGEMFGNLPADHTRDILDYLAENNDLHRSGEGWHWMGAVYPAAEISLRSVTDENFLVVEEEKERVLAEVDFHSAPETLHEGAIHMVEGTAYEVRRLDWDGRKAYVARVEAEYFTTAEQHSEVTVLDRFDGLKAGIELSEYGEVRIRRRIVGFKKIKFDTSENLGFAELDMPEQEMVTTSHWFSLPAGLYRKLEVDPRDVADGLAGIAHAMHGMATLLLMCDMRDLGRCIGDRSGGWFAPHLLEGGLNYGGLEHKGETPPAASENAEPTLFIYDNFPGGIGLARRLWELHDTLIRRTYELVTACRCAEGCPSCIGPQVSLDSNAKKTAIDILKLLLDK